MPKIPTPPPQPASPYTDALPDPTLGEWLHSPVLSYSFWIDLRPYTQGTRNVKRAMWGKFIAWCEDKHLDFSKINSIDLDTFLNEAGLVKEQRLRYIRLIERVFIHLNNLGLGTANPGTKAAMEKIGKGDNDKTVFFDEEERRRIAQVIESRLFRFGVVEKKEEKKGKGRKRQGWVLARDAAITATMLGAGASVGVVVSLTVNCTNSDLGKIRLPKESGGEYQAVFLPFAENALQIWIRLRRNIFRSVGDFVFPADLKLRIAHPDQTHATMHPSTIFRAVRSVLAEAGIFGPRACGQTLRNTYAAMLFELAFSDQEVAEAMGFAETASATRLRKAWLDQAPNHFA